MIRLGNSRRVSGIVEREEGMIDSSLRVLRTDIAGMPIEKSIQAMELTMEKVIPSVNGSSAASAAAE